MPVLKYLEYIIIILFEFIFIALGIQALIIGDTHRFTFLIVAMILALLPVVLERIMGIFLPFGVKSMICLALFLHLAGGIMRWYWIYQPFYDKFAHFIAAFAIGLLVFVFFLLLDSYDYKISVPKVLVGIFLITLILGGVWEVGERTLDIMLSSSYNNGMIDTIGDVIGNFFGIIAALLVSYSYIRKIPAGEKIAWLLRMHS